MAANASRTIGPIRFTLICAAIACCRLLAAERDGAWADGDNGHPTPVLVELFTSEGCSDCPPADALLARLDSSQFVPGAFAIVLSEHVTYWNQLGWRDPFSFEKMDARQQEYSDRFGLNSVYTPQIVVDGTQQFVGSDSRALSRAVEKASSTGKPSVEIVDPRWQNGRAIFSVQSDAGNRTTRWFAAIAVDATRSEVARGENAGRTLHHVAVVRVLQQLKRNATTQDFSLPVDAGGGSSGSLRLVVFAVDAHTGKVIAAAERAINR
jgi:hypothetical protein